ncbi:MAG: DUF6567 family protein [Phocaeicola sp.]
MKKTLLFSAIALVASLSSCSISKEATGNLNATQTTIVLSKNNYKVIGNVSGVSEQLYVLGLFGGLSSKSVNESAISEMYKNADLKGGARAIINTNIQYKKIDYVLWGKRKAIANGTIIEFVD